MIKVGKNDELLDSSGIIVCFIFDSSVSKDKIIRRLLVPWEKIRRMFFFRRKSDISVIIYLSSVTFSFVFIKSNVLNYVFMKIQSQSTRETYHKTKTIDKERSLPHWKKPVLVREHNIAYIERLKIVLKRKRVE